MTHVALTDHARRRISERLHGLEQWLVAEVAAAIAERRVTSRPPEWVRQSKTHAEFAAQNDRRDNRYVRLRHDEQQIVAVIAPLRSGDGHVVVTVLLRRNTTLLRGTTAERRASRTGHGERRRNRRGRGAA